ncbi:conserved hypothetical protein [Ricinus communis]|uniref:Uncharacterized protein n=1 Tax=Ricinus communis TaxID=3988 RepID=B9T5R5_RICCO|nr:conserved hypothetical protein [Ricinus communis]
MEEVVARCRELKASRVRLRTGDQEAVVLGVEEGWWRLWEESGTEGGGGLNKLEMVALQARSYLWRKLRKDWKRHIMRVKKNEEQKKLNNGD